MPALDNNARVANNSSQDYLRQDAGTGKSALLPVLMLPLMGFIAFILLFLPILYNLIRPQRSASSSDASNSNISVPSQSTSTEARDLAELDARTPQKTCKELKQELSNSFHPLWANMEANMTCVICLEEFTDTDNVRHLPCEHTFHSGCIAAWYLAAHDTCPVCAYDFVLARPPLQKPCQAHL
ncbi:hypothetical protein FVEN_g2097 [Fusarium venenatum]|uniref:uncharacterized protein n=1 Tax=Fusarium venenatum TaxID=56646 RepID=UPI001D4C8195|nr:hypothetical protein FVEN_g2097 [Fusarium venenatum]KAH6979121.1 hypothetical protein EDB82DRAFT_507103 [Fusarium venenatum]